MKLILLIAASVLVLSAAACLIMTYFRKRECRGARTDDGFPQSGDPSGAADDSLRDDAAASGTSCGDLPACDAVSDDTAEQEEIIRDIYLRLENYFDTAKPYLDGRLTISDVARKLYTNKAYVSKAVNRMSGLNFSQYVNKRRIAYALELFVSNPDLRINELAHLSGFNSVASFNISFRNFVRQSPSEWAKRVRSE